jgi:hypothetical protein
MTRGLLYDNHLFGAIVFYRPARQTIPHVKAARQPATYEHEDPEMNAVFERPTCHEALERLKDKHLLKSLGYVGGRLIANGANRTFEVRDPASALPLAWMSFLDADETAAAIDAASTAVPKWRAQLPQDQAKIFRRWYELILAAKGRYPPRLDLFRPSDLRRRRHRQPRTGR